jgi:hypothetical protein
MHSQEESHIFTSRGNLPNLSFTAWFLADFSTIWRSSLTDDWLDWDSFRCSQLANGSSDVLPNSALQYQCTEKVIAKCIMYQQLFFSGYMKVAATDWTCTKYDWKIYISKKTTRSCKNRLISSVRKWFSLCQQTWNHTCSVHMSNEAC